ncbi:V-type ATP synthase subunit F [Anaerococcus lactolyticus]|uniref:V-type ATP synthase subunit F n=1 Tax=Anaerococcus lactolyticus TaxID=33032 RepID=UPI0023F55559|nr:V-type ATP synthase subunit F [Anaerococcus lactolyticus]
MYKIGVIGDKDSILAFKAIGIDAFIAIDDKDASKLIDKLAGEGYGVIFITEAMAELVSETIDKYRESMTPAIILIPSNKGSLGIGLADINRSVEKAVGANILN